VLKTPDFITATRVQDEVNKHLGEDRARALDSTSILIPLNKTLGAQPIELIASLEQLVVQPDIPARVVINERTGTIIMGENVNISTVAVAHGNLNVTIRAETQVSQPNEFAGGQTEVIQQEDITVTEDMGQLYVMKQSISISDVVNALNALGATPRDLIAIIQALRKAGALQAELVAM
jgi:flagellar P-ring protein precursor FlgI